MLNLRNRQWRVKSVSDKSRVILVNDSLLLQGMLKRVLEKTKRIEVVGEVDLRDLENMMWHTNADWVIINTARNENDMGTINDLMEAHPSVRFLMVTTDGSQVQMKWFELSEKNLSGLSLAELLKVLVEKH